jgi:hypothetical protein
LEVRCKDKSNNEINVKIFKAVFEKKIAILYGGKCTHCLCKLKIKDSKAEPAKKILSSNSHVADFIQVSELKSTNCGRS